jgi:hypothetical protein
VKKNTNEKWFTITDIAENTTEPTDFGFFDLGRFIILPSQSNNPPRYELLNGISTRHYSFDEHSLINSNITFEQTTGDLWLADIGDYVVQYVISTNLTVIIPDQNIYLIERGYLKLEYNLTDINAEFNIIPPVATLNINHIFNRVTRLSDTQIISVFPNLVEFTIPLTATEAAIFYRNQFIKLGWQEDDFAVFEEKAELHFSTEEERVKILITPYEDKNRIKVLISSTMTPVAQFSDCDKQSKDCSTN